jgi:hypothetical protein
LFHAIHRHADTAVSLGSAALCTIAATLVAHSLSPFAGLAQFAAQGTHGFNFVRNAELPVFRIVLARLV